MFLTDLHYGYERRGGHKVPLHDAHAMSIALQFTLDFNPDILILGGDVLDCGAISHHNARKPGNVEGLRLLSDAEECRARVIEPLEQLSGNKVYLIGNHEKWLSDITDEIPGLEGLVSINRLLSLHGWTVVPHGGYYHCGKLTFLHGDQVRGGEYCAKAAVLDSERNVRFGHHHTFQAYTKISSIDTKQSRTGIAVPCLCHRRPKYGGGHPNRWVQGFNYGYLDDKGYFTDYVPIIANRHCMIEGKVYRD